MTKLLLFTILILLTIQDLTGQIDIQCGTGLDTLDYHPTPFATNCTKSSSDFHDFYKKKESFIPKADDDPIIIHVNFNVWQRSDGSGNLIENQETLDRINQIFDWVNGHFQNLVNFGVPLSYPIDNLNDSKIRIQLDSIFFYQDPSTDSSYFYGTPYSLDNCGDTVLQRHYPPNSLLQNYIQSNFPDRIRALNIHLTGGEYCGVGGLWQTNAVQSFYKRIPPMVNDNVHDWWFGLHFAHEIGHALGLHHTYDSPGHWGGQSCYLDGDDFLWDIFDTTQYCATSCDVCLIPSSSNNNNIMGGGSSIHHISDLQKGIIHLNLRTENLINTNWTSGRGIRDHATGYSTTPYEITQNETWDFSMKFYQDIVIKSGNTLTIQCEIQFVPEAKIIVESGAKLIIDGGKLTNENYYRTFWRGIEVWGNHNLPQTEANQGVVELKNDGIIEYARNGIRTIERLTSGYDWSKIVLGILNIFYKIIEFYNQPS